MGGTCLVDSSWPTTPTHSDLCILHPRILCLPAFSLIPADSILRSSWAGCRTKATTCTAVYVDLGQPCEDREAILKKARDCGAASARIVDAREELCRDFAFPVLQWQAKYEGIYCWARRSPGR